MEPNGLRHRECKIRDTSSSGEEEDVVGVAFNSEGDLLAVSSAVTVATASRDDDDDDERGRRRRRYGRVQLYHRSNYHWYLKYELRYDGGASPDGGDDDGDCDSCAISAVRFSEDDPYAITVALLRGGGAGAAATLEWREYAFRWEPSTVCYRSSSAAAANERTAVLAVAVDGGTLNFTPLDRAIVPPPMCAASLELRSPVVGIASRPSFCDDEADGGATVEFVVAMSDGKLALLQSGGDGSSEGEGASSSLTPGFRPPSILAVVDPFGAASTDEVSDEVGAESKTSFRGACLRDLTIIDADEDSLTVVALSCSNATGGGGRRSSSFGDDLIEMKISCLDGCDAAITSSVALKGRGLRIVNWSDTAYSPGARGGALLQLADGTLLEYSRGGVLEPCEAGPLLESCPWIAGVYDSSAGDAAVPPVEADVNGFGGQGDESSKRLVVGLSTRYRLYCGERLLSSASSSFAVSLQHKFLTHVTIGSQPQLRFLPLASLSNFDPLMGSEEHHLDGYEPRSVERGARLVAIFPSKPTVILQMPRGNLEGISPRALVLPYTMMNIQEGDFLTALDMMRRQRVDMNLIVDLDPIEFLEKGGAERFIGQIENINNLNLFLSSLIDVDTTLWKYPVPSWIRAAKPTQISDSKVNRVCEKVRQVMLDAERDGVTASGKIVKKGHFLLPTLSTFAKESPPKLEEALSLIKNSAPDKAVKQSKRKSILFSDHVQDAIKYLAFLANYEHIFDTAIGLYDFDLAKAVARHSQMDPKVYLPMLKRWREMPENTARYEVDVKLKRYESALRHLVAAVGDEEDLSMKEHFQICLSFIEEHNLHSLGLELFRFDGASRRAVMVSLGERLLSERKAEEALTVFLACNPRHLDGGKRAARSCGDWRTYFACCAEGQETVEEGVITAFAESIASKFGNLRQQQEYYQSAASILLDYGEDVAHAIDMLISAHLWSEGRRIAHLHQRTDLVKKVVDSSVSYARTCIEDLSERASTFTKANERYAEVIVLRRDAIREGYEAGVAGVHDDSASMFSMQSTASNTSLRSSASGSSIGSVGSVGTVASVSTVISVGATSTFSFTGNVDMAKHKSKFNKIGRDNKKKKKQKKKGPAARRTKPGSEEELKELISTLKYTCPDEHYVDVISRTINFLLQTDKQSMATLLFESFSDLESTVTQSRSTRMEQDKKKREESEQRLRKEGGMSDFIEHPCEKDINQIECRPLAESVRTILSLLVSS